MTPDAIVGVGLIVAAAGGLLAASALRVRSLLTIERRRNAAYAAFRADRDLTAIARTTGVLIPSAPALLPVLDHTLCAGDCGAVICRCHEPVQVTCDDTVEQACGHLNAFCADCALRECRECLSEATCRWFGGDR